MNSGAQPKPCQSQLGAKTTKLKLLPHHSHKSHPVYFSFDTSMQQPVSGAFKIYLNQETEFPPRSGLSETGSMPGQAQD